MAPICFTANVRRTGDAAPAGHLLVDGLFDEGEAE